MLKIQKIGSDLNITLIKNSLKINAATMRQVNDIWESESRQRKIFNGQIISVKVVEDNTIFVYPAEYRFFLAQKKCSQLYESLQIRPLAVSGLLECEDGIVFGKRGYHSTQNASQIELVPSGSLTPENIDYRYQILLELQEECGIAENDINKIEPFLLVEDLEDKVFDIGIYLRTTLKSNDIINRFQAMKNNEYTELEVIERAKINHYLLKNDVVPVSKKLLNYEDIVC